MVDQVQQIVATLPELTEVRSVWEIATAGLTEACQQIIEPQLDAFRSAGAFAPPLAVPADASAQTRFLAMLGRTG
jgi:hypothetical protein